MCQVSILSLFASQGRDLYHNMNFLFCFTEIVSNITRFAAWYICCWLLSPFVFHTKTNNFSSINKTTQQSVSFRAGVRGFWFSVLGKLFTQLSSLLSSFVFPLWDNAKMFPFNCVACFDVKSPFSSVCHTQNNLSSASWFSNCLSLLSDKNFSISVRFSLVFNMIYHNVRISS